MSHIFISYSRRDIDFAQKIVDALSANKLDTWIDWKSIPKGEKWLEEIYRGIEGADAFLFLISPDSAISVNCNKEIEHAIKNNKRIIPVVIRDADLKAIHSEISKRNWIFCRDGQDDFNKAIEETRETIHTDYEWLKYHTELQVKALKWEQKKDNSRLLRGKELREAEKQLADIGSQEDPQPTKLQREYILASQSNEIRIRRQITIGLIVGLLIMLVIAFVAVWQWQRAEKQYQIALTSGLAARSKVIGVDTGTHFIQSSLLAVESNSRIANLEASDVLRERLSLLPQNINYMYSDQSVTSIAYDPNGKYVAIGTEFLSDEGQGSGKLVVLDATTCAELYSIAQDGEISFIKISSDGKLILTGDEDGKARIWDSLNGTMVTEVLNGASLWKGSIYASFNPDGSLAVIATDKATYIVDSRTGTEIARINYVTHLVDFSYDGKYIVLANGPGRVIVWDFIANSVQMETSLFPADLDYVRFVGNGAFVVARSLRGDLIAVNTISGERINLAKGVGAIAFSENGEQLSYYHNYLNLIIVLDTNTWKELGVIRDVEQLTSLSINYQHRILVATTENGNAEVWDLSKLKKIIKLPLEGDNSKSVSSISLNGKFAAVGNPDGIITVFNFASAGQLTRVDYERIDIGLADWWGSVEDIFISADGRYAVSSSASGSTLVDVKENKILIDRKCENSKAKLYISKNDALLMLCSSLISLPDLSEIHNFDDATNITISPNGNLVAYIIKDSETDPANLVVWDVASREIINSVILDLENYGLSFSTDSTKLVVSSKGNIWFIDPFTGVFTGNIINDTKVEDYAFSSDGTLLAAIFQDGIINVWDARNNDLIFANQQPSEDNYSFININPNNNSLMLGKDAKTLDIWNINDNIAPQLKITQDDRIMQAIFSPDGSLILTGSQKGIVRVFDAITGLELSRMYHNDTGLENYIRNLAMSENNRYIMSGSYDGTARVWIWQSQDLIDETCKRMPRNLTHAEWNQYVGESIPYHATCPNLPIEPEVIMTPTP